MSPRDSGCSPAVPLAALLTLSSRLAFVSLQVACSPVLPVAFPCHLSKT